MLADKAPRDEVLNTKAKSSHINRVNRAHGQLKNNKIPAAVAIPFPPLNNKKGLNIWPNIDNKLKLKKRVINNSSFRVCLKVISAKYSIIKLLDISKINVNAAINLFPVLKTFVAPMLPDPIFLISPYPEIFTIIKPKGMDAIIKPTNKYIIILWYLMSSIKFSINRCIKLLTFKFRRFKNYSTIYYCA